MDACSLVVDCSMVTWRGGEGLTAALGAANCHWYLTLQASLLPIPRVPKRLWRCSLCSGAAGGWGGGAVWAGAPTPGAVRVPSSVTVRGATALLLLLDHIHEGILWVDL